MRRECLRIEDVIWECAGNGTDLPRDAQRHIDGCAECARTLNAAGTISPALRVSDRIPVSPDCRAGVMARISGADIRRRWTYAWAGVGAVAVALIVFGAFRLMPVHTNRSVVVKKPPVAPKVERHFGIAPPVTPRPVVTAAENRASWKAGRFGIEEPKHRKGWPSRKSVRVAVKRPPAPRGVAVDTANAERRLRLAKQRAEAAAAAESSRPVAVVMVSWEPSGGDKSYGYVQKDNDTGAITTCQVSRVGNSINVRMEQTAPANQLNRRNGQ